MNAAAAQHAQVRAAQGPEIVVIHKDDESVEKVDTSERMLHIAKIAAMIIVPLVLGFIVGAVGRAASYYNRSLTNAEWLAKQVQDTRVSVGTLKSTMLKAIAEKKKGSDPRKSIVDNFKVPDRTLLKKLEKAEERFKPLSKEALKRRMFDVDDELQKRFMEFFSNASLLKRLLRDHIVRMKRDMSALSQANPPNVQKDPKEKTVCCERDPSAEGKGLNCSPCLRVGEVKQEPNAYIPYRWAIYLPKKDEEEKKNRANPYRFPGAVLVEVGKPYCEDPNDAKNKFKVSDTDKCPQGQKPVGFKIRHDPTRTRGKQVWESKFVAQVKGDESELTELDRVVPLLPSAALDFLLIGSQPAVSNVRYQERMERIQKLTEKVFKDGEALAAQLKATAKKGKKFSFFL